MPERSAAEEHVRERLSLLDQQKNENLKTDAVLARLAKSKRRQDFKQKVKPTFEKVKKIASGAKLSHFQPTTVLEAAAARRKGITQGVESIRHLREKMLGERQMYIEKGREGQTIVVDPAQRWTTSGYEPTEIPGRVNEPRVVEQRRKIEKPMLQTVREFMYPELKVPGVIVETQEARETKKKLRR